MIIHDPNSPYKNQYDEEIVLTVSDWYHTQVPDLITRFVNVANPTGAEPIPDAALINDTQNLTVSVLPGKTYLVHLINVGAFAGQYIWFEGHSMSIIEVDGIYTEPGEASMVYVTAAQRYTVLITTNNDTSSNFAFVASMDTVSSTAVDVGQHAHHDHRHCSITYRQLSILTSQAGLCMIQLYYCRRRTI